MGKLGTALALVSALSGANAFWRLECRGRVALARMDPIVAFGKDSSHMHAIHGPSSFSETATSDILRSGDCTSCAVTEDMSAYWTPPMYFAHSNGTFELLTQKGGMLSYYLQRDSTNNNQNITAFPDGFRMISGDTFRRNYTLGDPSQPDPGQSTWAALGQTNQSDLAQRAIGFNCLDYSKQAEASLYRHFMPDKSYLDANCPDGLRLEVAFPSCWNGKDLDSDNHKSHVAFPDLVQDGACPEGFETRLVTLFYETIWDTYAFKDADGYFVIGNGDPTGYGYHGDFLMGWATTEFLQSAIDECTNESGEQSDCPLFTIQDEDTQRNCTAQSSILDTLKAEVANLLSALPGDVEIQWGPGYATAGAAAGTSTTAAASSYTAPTLTYTPRPSSGGIYIEVTSSSSESVATTTSAAISSSESVATTTSAAISSSYSVSVHANAAPQVNSVVSSAEAPATTPAPTTSDGGVSYEVVSTEYRTTGALVEEIIWEEAVVYVTEDSVTTVTVQPLAKERRRLAGEHVLRHRHLHGHGHHH